MAWDIYGHRLTPGYCEVHPWVPQEYPCYECMLRIEADNKQRDERALAENAYKEEIEAEYREHCEGNELTIVAGQFKMIKRFLTIN